MSQQSAWALIHKRFVEILDAMDAFEMDEDLEELNAQLEDTLFFMENLDPEELESAEEMKETLEEVEELLAEYQALSLQRPELRQRVLELQMALEMAKRNLN